MLVESSYTFLPQALPTLDRATDSTLILPKVPKQVSRQNALACVHFVTCCNDFYAFSTINEIVLFKIPKSRLVWKNEIQYFMLPQSCFKNTFSRIHLCMYTWMYIFHWSLVVTQHQVVSHVLSKWRQQYRIWFSTMRLAGCNCEKGKTCRDYYSS